LIFYGIRWVVQVSVLQAQMNRARDDSDCHLKDGEAVHLSARAVGPMECDVHDPGRASDRHRGDRRAVIVLSRTGYRSRCGCHSGVGMGAIEESVWVP
jgi:hypothetical protein